MTDDLSPRRGHAEPSNRLAVLASEIMEAHHASETARKTSLERAKEAGAKLIEAKRLVSHGNWLPWLAGIGLPQRTAHDYMTIAGLAPAKLATVADLGMRAALETIRIPRPDPAAQRGQPNRDDPDFWPTPACLTTALLRHVIPHLPPGPIWECAAGDGRLARAIAATTGRQVIATDLYPQDGSAPHDFLTDEPPAATHGAIVLTNPPFSKLDEILARGLMLLDSGQITGLVLLLRHDHLMTATRVEIFNRAVREIHCNWRPIWIDDTDGNPRWSFHWLVWLGGPRQPPQYLDESDVRKNQEE
jgi:hypothetical protein